MLNVAHVSKFYPLRRGRARFFSSALRGNAGIWALANVSFDVDKEEIFGLLGPNGAGKTTLIKIICTLVLPTEGTVTVNGHDVVREKKDVVRDVGVMLGEVKGFYWRLKGRENLELYARLHEAKNPKKRVDEVLEIVGLTKQDADLRFQEYSSGMKQKLAFAKALLPDPPVILLDEPTLGLDVATSFKIREFVQKYLNRERKKTILLTTHNMSEAEELCTRIAVISKGRIIQISSPDEIKKIVKPTIRFKIAPKDVGEKIRRIDGVIEVHERMMNGYMILDVVVDKDSDLSLILNTLLKETKIFDVNSIGSSLERAFLQLTEDAENGK